MRLLPYVSVRRYKVFPLLVVILLLLSSFSFAQRGPIVQATVDRTSILIGEQIKYTIKTEFPENGYSLHLPVFKDSINAFEIVTVNKADSTIANGTITCTQSVVLTSFDSGRHTIPALNVNFDPYIDDTTLNLPTDSFVINVGFAPADSVKTFHDIKPIIEVKDEWPWWVYVAIGAGILLLIFIIKKMIAYSRRPKSEVSQESALSPYDEAIQALQQLQKENLLQNNEVKVFHTRLSGIFRRFASRRQGIHLAGVTTDELLIKLESGTLEQYSFSRLAGALRMGDAVKFAKFIPPVTESEYCLQVIRETVDSLKEDKKENSDH